MRFWIVDRCKCRNPCNPHDGREQGQTFLLHPLLVLLSVNSQVVHLVLQCPSFLLELFL